MTAMPAGNGSRGKMLLIAALFAAPVIAATALYYSGWRPAAAVNHGDLLQPARPIQDVALLTDRGQPTRFDALPKKWTVLHFVTGRCDAACDTLLYRLHQIHLGLGKDADRVQRVVVVSGDDPSIARALAAYPGAVVLTGNAAQLGALRAQFDASGNADRIYLVDPLRNYFMSYSPDAEPSGIRKDLVRLLKVSRIG